MERSRAVREGGNGEEEQHNEDEDKDEAKVEEVVEGKRDSDSDNDNDNKNNDDGNGNDDNDDNDDDDDDDDDDGSWMTWAPAGGVVADLLFLRLSRGLLVLGVGSFSFWAGWLSEHAAHVVVPLAGRQTQFRLSNTQGGRYSFVDLRGTTTTTTSNNATSTS